MEDRPSVDTADVLADVAHRLGSSLDLTLTLEEIALSVVERIGFGIAVLNLITTDGDLQVVAVAGPDDVRHELLGSRQSAQDWAHALAASEPRGRLRFLDGRAEELEPSHLHFYTPDIAVPTDITSWHPLDALFAPLYGEGGVLQGVLSVDLPTDGQRPDADDCKLLEVFAIQAALAIDHARLYQDLQNALEDQKRIQAELRHRALHDSLTGLANRELVLDRLDQALARSRRDGRAVAVLFLDVDHFKLVNDSLGHGIGDELLVSLSQVLTHHLREVDTAGRLGGDEFVLVLEELSGPSEAIAVADRLLAAVKEPLELAGETVKVSISVGISLAGPGSYGGELLAEADTALYRAKAAGRGRWEVFDAQMRSEALALLALRSELSGAVGRGEFRLHYQPIVDLLTQRPLGYEALLRWEHPTRGLLVPGDFLAVLEDSDADAAVAEWVLSTACADAAAWPDHLFVSVNVSPRQLAHPELARRVGDVVTRTGLPPDQLWIEVTEDRPLDANQDVADVQRLRDLGVHVVLDDFGTGYAGLTYLQRLPADVVKIDMVFIQQIQTDPVSRSIVEAVVGLAQVLGLRVVAEGVETAAQATVLLEMGLTIAQGYLWGRPAPLPGADTSVALLVPMMADDLAGELRRLNATLTASNDKAQVARAAVQAGRRVLGADGGALVLLGSDGNGHLVHADGYSDEVLEAFRVIPTLGDLPFQVTLREGTAIFHEQSALGEHPHVMVRALGTVVTAEASVPVVSADGLLLGAFGLSWSTPVELAERLQETQSAMGLAVGRRLGELGVRP